MLINHRLHASIVIFLENIFISYISSEIGSIWMKFGRRMAGQERVPL